MFIYFIGCISCIGCIGCIGCMTFNLNTSMRHHYIKSRSKDIQLIQPIQPIQLIINIHLQFL